MCVQRATQRATRATRNRNLHLWLQAYVASKFMSKWGIVRLSSSTPLRFLSDQKSVWGLYSNFTAIVGQSNGCQTSSNLFFTAFATSLGVTWSNNKYNNNVWIVFNDLRLLFGFCIVCLITTSNKMDNERLKTNIVRWSKLYDEIQRKRNIHHLKYHRTTMEQIVPRNRQRNGIDF